VVNEQAVNSQQAASSASLPVTNAPLTADQSEADRARAALGGAAAETISATDGEQSQPAPRPGRHVRGKNAPPPPRFKPPQDLEFEFTHPERVELRNSNLPLTLGLLGSILGAFVVFFASLAGGTAGADPIMPSFWRALGALAVLMALSFAASWFMPAPVDRRRLLDQLDAEEKLTYEHLSGGRKPGEAPPPPPQPETDLDDAFSDEVGGNIDVTLDDLDGFDPDAGQPAPEDDFLTDDFEEEDDDPFAGTAADIADEAAPAAAGNEGR
jgi:hypothetical protein